MKVNVLNFSYYSGMQYVGEIRMNNQSKISIERVERVSSFLVEFIQYHIELSNALFFRRDRQGPSDIWY
jgi:hypothetical protein